MATLRFALAQFDFPVGAVTKNGERMRELMDEARDAHGAQLIAFPELAVAGYPPEDLLLRPSFLAACEKEVAEVAASANGIAAYFGHPHAMGEVYNAASLAHRRRRCFHHAQAGAAELHRIRRKALFPVGQPFGRHRFERRARRLADLRRHLGRRTRRARRGARRGIADRDQRIAVRYRQSRDARRTARASRARKRYCDRLRQRRRRTGRSRLRRRIAAGRTRWPHRRASAVDGRRVAHRGIRQRDAPFRAPRHGRTSKNRWSRVCTPRSCAAFATTWTKTVSPVCCSAFPAVSIRRSCSRSRSMRSARIA